MSSLRPVQGSAAGVTALLVDWLADPAEPEPLEVVTSGSTGTPKRVLLSRAAVLASARATHARLGGPGRWVLALPVSYVAGLQVVVRSLEAGHAPVLLDDHGSWSAALDAARATGAPAAYTSLVPTQLHRALTDPEHADDLAALASLDAVLLGGGATDPGLRRRAEAAGVRVVTTYGSSETSGGCVYDGLPLDGVRVRLEPGTDRVLLAGPTLFDGYAEDPVRTAEVLVDGWFRTDDRGRLDAEGRLELLGRVDDVVVSGGLNVPTAAVAARLREHPGVAGAAVLGTDDPEWGQRVVAVVVPAADVDRGELLRSLRDWVAEVHPRAWAPRAVALADELPLTERGKPDRRALAAVAAAAPLVATDGPDA